MLPTPCQSYPNLSLLLGKSSHVPLMAGSDLVQEGEEASTPAPWVASTMGHPPSPQ